MNWGTLLLGLVIGTVVGMAVMALVTRRCTCYPPDVSVED